MLYWWDKSRQGGLDMRQNHRAGRGQARHGGRRRAGADVTRRGFLLGAGAAALGAAGLWLRGCVRPDGGGASSGPAAPAAGEWRGRLDQLYRTAGDGLHFGGGVPGRGRGHDG